MAVAGGTAVAVITAWLPALRRGRPAASALLRSLVRPALVVGAVALGCLGSRLGTGILTSPGTLPGSR